MDQMGFARERTILFTGDDSVLWSEFVRQVGEGFRPPGIPLGRWKEMAEGINRISWRELAVCYVWRIPDHFRRAFFGPAVASAFAAEQAQVRQERLEDEATEIRLWCRVCKNYE
jgi:hypothetical protein